jgi:hypothetical protein
MTANGGGGGGGAGGVGGGSVGGGGGTSDGGKDGGTDAGFDGGSCVLDAGLPNCKTPACLGRTCGANGDICVSDGGCACSGNGGTPEATETSCSDGIDNDCDGKIDCADPDCNCETNCSDGIDNDGNGKTDCQDPNCLDKLCTTDGGHACCGTTCTDLTVSNTNCGGCGLNCASNRTCSKTGTTAQCTCSSTAMCPGSQHCDQNSNRCTCSLDSQCASGETCNSNSACEY